MAQAADPASPTFVTLFLCHSQLRAAQMHEFATELTAFCNEIVEVVNVDSVDEDAIVKLQNVASVAKSAAAGDSSSNTPKVFKKSVVLIGTPGNFAALL